MKRRYLVSYVQTPVSVAYRRAGGKCICTALEFDLVGIGETRKEALQALRGVVDTYLLEVLKEKEPVRILNRSDEREWRIKDQAKFRIVVVYLQKQEEPEIPQVIPRFEKIRDFRDRVQSFGLCPVGP